MTRAVAYQVEMNIPLMCKQIMIIINGFIHIEY